MDEAKAELPNPIGFSNYSYAIERVSTQSIHSGYAISDLIRAYLESKKN